MSGPYKYYVGLGLNFEGMTGHTWLRGYPDRDHPMHNTPLYHMDASGGACGAFAVLAALHYRNRTGKGQYIDIAGAETVIPHFGEAFMDYTMNRRVQRSVGNRDIHGAAPCGCYRSRGGPDEWVVITVGSDEEWQGLCRAMGNPPWSSDKRFSDVLGRWKNQDELDRLIEEWTNRHDKYETMIVFQKEGVPALPVIGARDAHHDPQLTARGFLEVISHRETGVHLYPGFQWKYSKTPMRVRRPPVCLGEHNEYVFREVLHMAEDEKAELEAKQIIGGDAFVEGLTTAE
jgi:crotonobetainyl-CoA:carnitine CoA-transferase CaiB-like acyl-CoA transferase